LKTLKTQHWSGSFLDKMMILLNDTVKVFDFPDLDLFIFCNALVSKVQSYFIAATLTNRYFGSSTIVFDRLFEKSFCCNCISLGYQQKINGITLAISGTIQIDSFAFQFNAGLIHPPTALHQFLALAHSTTNQFCKSLYPSF
jgi:hypothetical protein